jgi:hypothetical protein
VLLTPEVAEFCAVTVSVEFAKAPLQRRIARRDIETITYFVRLLTNFRFIAAGDKSPDV